MAYKGRSPEIGAYRKLDNISGDFDGSEKTFNLTLGGDPYYTTNAYTLMVVLNGVIQEPVTAFTILNDTITFTSAPSSSPTSFYIMSLGNTFHTGGMKSIPVFNRAGSRYTVPLEATNVPVYGRTDLGHDSIVPVLINPA
tara:strand:+ start:1528 stop:1947 length:420 start_codon:yes stop_codon:yes gene_type:complete